MAAAKLEAIAQCANTMATKIKLLSIKFEVKLPNGTIGNNV